MGKTIDYKTVIKTTESFTLSGAPKRIGGILWSATLKCPFCQCSSGVIVTVDSTTYWKNGILFVETGSEKEVKEELQCVNCEIPRQLAPGEKNKICQFARLYGTYQETIVSHTYRYDGFGNELKG